MKIFITLFLDLKRYCLDQIILFMKQVMETIIVKTSITIEIVTVKSLKMKLLRISELITK
ncbi:hypothetical protein DOX48_03375 [Cronobacter malonaticus]|nr:hypothetical protein [Cronobacter malonaticus]EGT4312514.1 hypothetical protein [Cronobacter malonaticus]EGT4335732.1 hypothetical protein [Cronobacter malonaticus]